MGVRVARALRVIKAPDLDCVTLTDFYRGTPSHGLEIPDERWMRDAAAEGLLALTQDRHILERPLERQAIVEHRVGLVLLTPGDAVNFDVLAFIVRKLDWLREIDREPRPFVYRASVRGRARGVGLGA